VTQSVTESRKANEVTRLSSCAPAHEKKDIRYKSKKIISLNSKRGESTPRARPNSTDPDLLHDVEAVKAKISKEIFADRLKERNWTQDALRALAALMPMSKSEIWTVGFYYSENPQKDGLSLTTLLRYWNDRYTRAALWEESNYPMP
jgi:hypothetical protein